MPDSLIYYIESTDSTMLEARRRTDSETVSGTAVWAGYQSAGRGRISGRRWLSQPGDSLLFTIIYSKSELAGRMAGKPFTLLPLLAGLAVSEAAVDFLGSDADIEIKWPNDVLSGGRKLCGILCEASGDWLYTGIGINLNQSSFPNNLRRPACSIRQLAGGRRMEHRESRSLIELIMGRLDDLLVNEYWNEALNKRLYKLGHRVRMRPGLPEELSTDAELIEGILAGVDNSGALLIDSSEGLIPVISGELLI